MKKSVDRLEPVAKTSDGSRLDPRRSIQTLLFGESTRPSDPELESRLLRVGVLKQVFESKNGISKHY